MFWDKIASLYDLFENVYNRKVYKGIGVKVAEFVAHNDTMLECACGTGAITVAVARQCRHVVATDYSEGMLKQARAKCSHLSNVTFERADISRLPYDDDAFDKVVAGNVIHLLDDPAAALHELQRVCRPGGQLVIPCYVNIKRDGGLNFGAWFVEKLGLRFKREFDYDGYRQFFAQLGYKNVQYHLVEGRMPCAIAVIPVAP
ncbi:MAG: methyltransferase domain-containing protein [Muribaculaceae bacterium]|nr:methyltransferase domain-containing protein [Muribaculaceae bacterium]